MKYSVTFIMVTFIGIIIAGAAVEAYLDHSPTLCAVLSIVSFYFVWGASMAPDNEKYSDEYNKKRKGL